MTRPAARFAPRDAPERLLWAHWGLLLAAVLAVLPGCKKLPAGRDAVARVDLQGVPDGYEGQVADGLSTKPSPHFLGIFPHGFVFEHELFDEAALEQDLERVERQLRRRGYYQAKVVAARVIRLGEDEVRVEIEVDPGERVRISEIRTAGLAQLPFDAAEHALKSIPIDVGEPFDEDEYEQAKVALANALADVGYAYVEVQGRARVDLTDNSADVLLTVVPGPRAHFGPVTIEGLDKIPEGPVRNSLQLREGAQYSRAELEAARAAMFRLGVFAKVEIAPQLTEDQKSEVPIVVRLEESALRSITAGGGATLDVLRLSAHGQVGWTHRNFLGGLRKFSLSSRPGVTFFPTRLDNVTEQPPTRALPENSLRLSLEQPSFIEGRTTGFGEANYNVYPLLYPLPPEADPDAERIIGYNEVSVALGIERLFLRDRLLARLSMNWRANFPFAYQGNISEDVPGLERVIVAYPELDLRYDLRDDPIQPTRGVLLSNSLQIARPVLGGIVSDVRLRPEVRTYVPLDFKSRVVLASRVTMGFAIPTSPAPYGSALLDAGSDLDYGNSDVIEDQHKLLFRAFYSGGPNSNRGYPYQRVGPHGPIGFLIPTGARCDGPVETLSSTCIRPLGGFSLWEASLELRFSTSGPWGFVAFADASDVSSKIATFNFNEPHVSIGPGIRYQSPVGPIRFDLGWRVPGLQKLSPTPEEPPDVSEVEPYVSEEFWEALAIHILIGEAF